MEKTAPWIEKYRPKNLDNIILEPINRKILNNIIKKKYFPNLLFYGPPGTGKTTTIINLINKFQEKYNQKNKGFVIHLNASDERGIDTIRTQIYQFATSKNIIGKGIKFVILDEVDYMTKNAQNALKYIIQQNTLNIRFCLICNYISKINISLQDEFINIKFCSLNKKFIHDFLKNICVKENIKIKKYQINNIIDIFKYDIRSMINFLQSNNYIFNNKFMINKKLYTKIIEKIKNRVNYKIIYNNIYNLSNHYNINKLDIVENIINILIKECYTPEWIELFKLFIHNKNDVNDEYIIHFFLLKSSELFNNS